MVLRCGWGLSECLGGRGRGLKLSSISLLEVTLFYGIKFEPRVIKFTLKEIQIKNVFSKYYFHSVLKKIYNKV